MKLGEPERALLARVKVDTVDKEQPLGRFLILLFSAFEKELVSELEKSGYGNVTLADLDTLRFVKPEGSTAVEIAELAGVSKQAVGKAVASLEKRRYLLRQTHPDDARAQLVTFTAQGERFLLTAIALIGGIERRYALLLGGDTLAHVKSVLGILIEYHRTGSAPSQRTTPGNARRRK